MAVRTTDAAVEAIIETISTISLTPFIEAANSLVTAVCVVSGSAYTAATLELIERWLSAHFYAIRDPRSLSERAGSVQQEIESKVDLGLDVTRYGQMAKRLDYEGYLAALDAQMKKGASTVASFGWLGKKEAEAVAEADD